MLLQKEQYLLLLFKTTRTYWWNSWKPNEWEYYFCFSFFAFSTHCHFKALARDTSLKKRSQEHIFTREENLYKKKRNKKKAIFALQRTPPIMMENKKGNEKSTSMLIAFMVFNTHFYIFREHFRWIGLCIKVFAHTHTKNSKVAQNFFRLEKNNKQKKEWTKIKCKQKRKGQPQFREEWQVAASSVFARRVFSLLQLHNDTNYHHITMCECTKKCVCGVQFSLVLFDLLLLLKWEQLSQTKAQAEHTHKFKW